MIKVNSFSFQGVNGAYSEQAGKNIYPNATSIPCATFEDMFEHVRSCLLYTSPSPRDISGSRMPSSA